MTPQCPRCGSTDIHSSRTKGAGDRVFRLLGLPPRRCAACGWRGHRPRILFPSRHGSDPSLPRVTSAPPPPSTTVPPASERRRRHRRHGHRIRSRRAAALQALFVALTLGVTAGFMAYSCGG